LFFFLKLWLLFSHPAGDTCDLHTTFPFLLPFAKSNKNQNQPTKKPHKQTHETPLPSKDLSHLLASGNGQ